MADGDFERTLKESRESVILKQTPDMEQDLMGPGITYSANKMSQLGSPAMAGPRRLHSSQKKWSSFVALWLR